MLEVNARARDMCDWSKGNLFNQYIKQIIFLSLPSDNGVSRKQCFQFFIDTRESNAF